jgi:dolichyl-phosphate-mannose--protein O-mannosyl transferase
MREAPCLRRARPGGVVILTDTSRAAAAPSRGWGAWTALPLAAFGGLLALHVADPAALVFDEAHYVPAAKALAHLADDLNWEHPPLSKWILGLGARVLSEELRLVGDPAAFRGITAAFGLWALASVAAFMRELRFPGWAAQAAVWLTGANVLWFVQSRTAMPDVFAAAFAIAGLLRVRRGGAGAGPWIGWAELGLAMACKWSAAPLCALAVLWSDGGVRRRVAGIAVSVAAYLVPFLPLALLSQHATPPLDLLGYQLRMLEGFGGVDLTRHPYTSRAWQWPTLLRPIWYHYESSPRGDRYVWAGGNPLLYACALPATALLAVRALRRSGGEGDRAIALLYWAPLLFWAALPRPQLYYYFLASSLWLGPAVVAAALPLRRLRPQLAIALLTIACVALFLWFSPLLDARLASPGSYGRYMWLRGWI